MDDSDVELLSLDGSRDVVKGVQSEFPSLTRLFEILHLVSQEGSGKGIVIIIVGVPKHDYLLLLESIKVGVERCDDAVSGECSHSCFLLIVVGIDAFLIRPNRFQFYGMGVLLNSVGEIKPLPIVNGY